MNKNDCMILPAGSAEKINYFNFKENIDFDSRFKYKIDFDTVSFEIY